MRKRRKYREGRRKDIWKGSQGNGTALQERHLWKSFSICTNTKWALAYACTILAVMSTHN